MYKDIWIRYCRYISFVFILGFLGQRAWGLCSECTDDSKITTMITCQSSASRLEQAEVSKNASLVCSRLHEVFQCVGEKVPQCLEILSEEYQKYTYTPWDCHISNEQVIMYQKLVQNGCTSKSETQTSNSAQQQHSGTIQTLLILSSLLFLQNS